METQFVIWLIGVPVGMLALAYLVILGFLLAARRRMNLGASKTFDGAIHPARTVGSVQRAI